MLDKQVVLVVLCPQPIERTSMFSKIKSGIAVLLLLLLFPSVLHAADKKAGPSLKVTVYAKDTQKPLHGATVTITDNWERTAQPRPTSNATNSSGIVMFSPGAFRFWYTRIDDLGQSNYAGEDPWDWQTGHGPAVFKAKVQVEIKGFKSEAKTVEITAPIAETTFYLAASEEGKPSVLEPSTPAPVAATDEVRKTDSADFQSGKAANVEIKWPDGSRAVTAEVSHQSILRDEEPKGYGLWLTVYVLNNQGKDSAFNGAKEIFVGNTDNGDTRIAEGKPQTLDCGDIVVVYKFTSLKYQRPAKTGNAGSFSGTISVEARMAVKK
jgi:hypothetical protein